MRWSDKETVQFIKLYLSHEILWNPDHVLYKIRGKRDAAYKAIAEEFRNFSGILLDMDELKTKIKNLRSTYTQEVTKIIQRSSEGYKPNLKWFKLWHECFKDLPSSRLKESSTEWQDVVLTMDNEFPQKSEWIEPESQKDDDNNTSYFDNDEDHPDPIVTENDDTSVLEDEEVKPLKRIKRENSHAIKRESRQTKSKKKKLKSYNFNPTQESIVQSSTETSNKIDDEFDIYGKYIASQLRSMGLSKALAVQMEIQRLVSTARMSDGNT